MNLSIIIPVYNGARTIEQLVEEVEKELADHFELEIVLINDGSPSDNSAQICKTLAETNGRIKFIDLSRNFGEHNAVMAGLNYCEGDAAVIIDDDFQNPPSEIIKLVERLSEGFDVVFARYEGKKHNFLRNFGSWLNDIAATVMIGKPVDLYLSSFKAVSRFVIDQIIQYTGPHPYVDGLIFQVTRNYSSVLVEHNVRREGKSGYTFRKLIGLWMNMFTNFSILPLRIASLMGLSFSFFGLIGGAIFFIEKIHRPDLPTGWASLIVSLFVISGIQLFAIGMVGEYLGRLFLKDNGNPQFVVRRSMNCRKGNNERS